MKKFLIAVLLINFLVFPFSVFAATLDEIQQQINIIEQKIIELLNQLSNQLSQIISTTSQSTTTSTTQ